MARFDDIGLFWQDLPSARKGGPRTLGPMPEIPETGWLPPTEFPNIRHAKAISFDVETFDPELRDNGPGWARGKGHLVGISMAVDGGKWYFPMRHEVQPELNMIPDNVLKWAEWALGGDSVKIGANITYDIGWLRQEGVNIPKGKWYDVQFAEALLAEKSRFNLEELGNKYVGQGKDDLLAKWCQEYYMTTKATWRRDIYRSPVTLAGAYGEQDAALPFQIIQKQWGLLHKQGLIDLFELECRLIPLLIDMRFAGITVDIPYAEKLHDRFETKEKELQKEINDFCGFSLNVNSGDELARAFDKNNITYPRTAPTAKNPKGNPSFVKKFLEGHKHQLPKLITQLRGQEKLRKTFVDGYILGSHVDGKVYGSFHPLSSDAGGTRTGRFSSSNPNLQNIPTRTKEGKMIRECFIMDQGHACVRAYDYSQIEYRMLAHFATGPGSEEVRKKFNDDPTTDYHVFTQDLVKQLTGIFIERKPIKNINFGLIYGLGKDALAAALNMSVKDALDLRTKYYEGVPFAKPTMDNISELTNEQGYITTVLGRRTRFDLWEPSSWGTKGPALPYDVALNEYEGDVKRAGLYKATNYRLQGSAAEVMKVAMVKCYESGIFDITGVPRLTVHDELVFSDPGGVDEAFQEMRHMMETALPLKVPVIADYEQGPSWGKVEEVK